MPAARSLLRTLLAGVGVGFFTLGLGGRVAMWAFALFTDRPNIVTLRGVLMVGLAGSIAGLVAAILYLLVGRWILPRSSIVLRGLMFGALTLLVASPGIRPPWLLTFALFAPAFLLYGVLLVAIVVRFSKHEPVLMAQRNVEVT